MTNRRSFLLSAFAIAATAAGALAQFSGTASQTIFLPHTPDGYTPMNVTYHPGFNQYYGSAGGNPVNVGHVWDAAGNVLQNSQTVNIDVRSFNYNSNTGQLEVMQYGANFGYNGGGRWDVVLDGSGLFTGNNNLLVSTVANYNDQSMPSYNAGADVFYSRADSGNTINVVDASTGNLSSTFNLDLASAGISGSDLTLFANSFDNQKNWLVYTNWTNNRAYVWDTAGAYLGYNDLPGASVASAFNVGGIANGQLFVFQNGGWQGYKLVPAPGAAALLGLSGLAAARRRRA